MATYNKFNLFTDDLVKGVMNFGSDVFKVMLTNTLPLATNHVYSDISGNEISGSGNGYTTGGATSAITLGNSSGTETVTAAAVTFTASGGSIGPFQYAVLYDSTPSTKTLICWFNYGSALTLAPGESLTVEPNSSPTTGTLFTLA